MSLRDQVYPAFKIFDHSEAKLREMKRITDSNMKKMMAGHEIFLQYFPLTGPKNVKKQIVSPTREKTPNDKRNTDVRFDKIWDIKPSRYYQVQQGGKRPGAATINLCPWIGQNPTLDQIQPPSGTSLPVPLGVVESKTQKECS